MTRAFSTLALIGLLAAPPALADDGDDSGHFASITFSPLHLLLPVGEVTAEFRAHDKVGVAVILGAGTAGFLLEDSDVSSLILEAGASARWYALGDFEHGMQLGVELLYVYIDLQATESSTTVNAFGNGFAVGPFIGYKIATDVGFTFDSQLGAAYAVGRAEAEATDGTSADDSTSGWGVISNLNIGWSF